MNDADPIYAADHPRALDSTAQVLEQEFRVARNQPRRYTRRFLDTFDWRLYNKGYVLEAREDAREARMLLRRLHGTAVIAETVVARAFEFCWDMPEGPLRQTLEPIIEMRQLRPLAHLDTQEDHLRLMDEEQKTLVKVVHEASEAPETGKFQRLCVKPVKGYDEPFRRTADLLARQPELSTGKDVMLASAEAAGYRPGSYSTKVKVHLQPHWRADYAAKRILLQLLDTLETNYDGTLEGRDSEFLHDFRVSVRRTRSALAQVKGVFPDELTEKFKGEFRWLGQLTGPARDMDVYLLAFDGYRDCLPDWMGDSLEPLRHYLEKQQHEGYQALRKALRSKRYQNLVGEWRRFLETPVPSAPQAPKAADSVLSVASRRIWKMYRRVIAEGEAITAQSAAEELHELRKSCKKLRYLMEFFTSLYPEDSVKTLIKELKRLQQNLGDYNDLSVQIENLQGFAEPVMAESGDTHAVLAMGALIGHLDAREKEVRREFEAKFAHFNRPELRKSFKQLFKKNR